MYNMKLLVDLQLIFIGYFYHIFLKYQVFQSKNHYFVISLVQLEFDKKTTIFLIKNFEILGFFRIEFEILAILTDLDFG